MKKNVLILTIVCICHIVLAQDKYVSIPDALRKAALINGQGGPINVNWIKDGNQFSYIKSPGKIHIFNPATLSDEIIFDGSNLKLPDSDQAFDYTGFIWTADFNYLLFQTNFKPVWRNSGNSDYFLYSLKDKSLNQ